MRSSAAHQPEHCRPDESLFLKRREWRVRYFLKRSVLTGSQICVGYTLQLTSPQKGFPVAERISIMMALEQLREQAEAVRTAKRKWEEEMLIRDDLIRECREARIPEGKLMQLTGLSRDSIHRIAHSGPRGVSDGKSS